MRLKRYFSLALSLLTLSFILTFGGFYLEKITQNRFYSLGQNPGYFEQWFNEKKNENGIIPRWRHAAWASADKNKLVKRNVNNPIDTFIEIGPFNVGGRTRAVWVDPRNDNYLLAAAISGGIWRSENGGLTWNPLNEQEISLMASTITHNPFNPDLVYYGTGETRANSADVNGNGVFKSTNGGRSFTQLPSTVGLAGMDAIWSIEHSVSDSNTLFVGTQGSGLYRSTDEGLSWEQVYNSANVSDIITLPNGRVIFSRISVGLYLSDSSGKKGTFQQLILPSQPSQGTYGRIELSYSRNYPNVVYALYEGIGFNDPPKAFYKSSNGGKTWVKRNTPSNIGSGYQTYCVMLGAAASDTNKVIAGGVYIQQSNDGGVSWFNKSLGHADHHGFYNLWTKTNEFLIGNDGGVYKYNWTTNGAISLNAGYKVTQFYAGAYGPSGTASVAGSQDNGTHYGYGSLLTRSLYGADGAYCHIGLQDGKVAYISTQNTGIRRIDNFSGFGTFSSSISDPRFNSEGVDFINAYAMNPGDQSQLYYRTNLGLYMSVDKGETWDKISLNRAGIKAIAVSNESNPRVYFGGTLANLYMIDDAVTANPGTEKVFSLSVPGNVTTDVIGSIQIDPNNTDKIYVSFKDNKNQPRVWQAEGFDSGNVVWKNLSGDLPVGLPVNFVQTDPAAPGKVLFAGTDFGLYYSTDSGKLWFKDTRIPNVAIHEIKLRTSDRNLFIYTHGRGMWVAKLKAAQQSIASIKVNAEDIKIYPNPSKGVFHVNVAKGNYFKAKVYTSDGRAIYQAANAFQGKLEIETTGWNSGIYFVELTSDKERIVRRVTVL